MPQKDSSQGDSLGKPTFGMWPISHLLTSFDHNKATREGKDIRPKKQKAIPLAFKPINFL